MRSDSVGVIRVVVLLIISYSFYEPTQHCNPLIQIQGKKETALVADIIRYDLTKMSQGYTPHNPTEAKNTNTAANKSESTDDSPGRRHQPACDDVMDQLGAFVSRDRSLKNELTTHLGKGTFVGVEQDGGWDSEEIKAEWLSKGKDLEGEITQNKSKCLYKAIGISEECVGARHAMEGVSLNLPLCKGKLADARRSLVELGLRKYLGEEEEVKEEEEEEGKKEEEEEEAEEEDEEGKKKRRIFFTVQYRSSTWKCYPTTVELRRFEAQKGWKGCKSHHCSNCMEPLSPEEKAQIQY